MRIRNLDTFYWIASLGSFRAAAEKLHLTQPAISARIQVLEQDLGAEVFVRELKKAELTPAGRKLLGFAERLMALEQDVLSAFADTSKIEQTIRVGASETIVSTWLPDFMCSLSQSRKNLSFDLRVDTTDNLRNSLVSRDIDLAFLMGPVAEVSVANHDICKYEMMFAAHADLARLHDTWRLPEIAQYPVLTFAANTKPSRQIREMLAPFCNGSPNMTTSASLGAIIRLAASGMGICAVPKAAIDIELRDGTLVALATRAELPTISFTASYVSASPIAGLIAAIISEVIDFLEGRAIKNIYQN
ncbi:MAG: LysR family transcriptional regulator [Hyphomicrobiales bacterium]|nr:LysR family transcriptional regulator [Hyphomicrobiales bacterium]